MDQLCIFPNMTTLSSTIVRFIHDKNLEMALHHLYTAQSHDTLPTAMVICAVVQLAAELGYPRLAIDLAVSYRIQSTGPRNQLVWTNCLLAAADHFYVSVLRSRFQVAYHTCDR